MQEEHVKERQELEQTQMELTRELKLKVLIIENFIPPEEKAKVRGTMLRMLYAQCARADIRTHGHTNSLRRTDRQTLKHKSNSILIRLTDPGYETRIL